MDGTAKGGALFGIRSQVDAPVKFLGVGEGLDDLQTFEAEPFVDAILAFGEREPAGTGQPDRA